MEEYQEVLFAGKNHDLTFQYKNQQLRRYHKSLVGRDFKVWCQIGVFIVWPFLTKKEKDMWLSLAEVSQITLSFTEHKSKPSNSFFIPDYRGLHLTG